MKIYDYENRDEIYTRHILDKNETELEKCTRQGEKQVKKYIVSKDESNIGR